MNRYSRLIEELFLGRHKPGTREVFFERDDIVRAAQKLGIRIPKNLGDIVYSFRYRSSLPDSVKRRAPEGQAWIIRPAGRARYCTAESSANDGPRIGTDRDG